MSAVRSSALCWALPAVCLLLVSAEQKKVTAECGQNITLTCRPPNNNTITGVEWSRADLEPEYFLVYRDGQVLSDNQHPSFRNRVELQDIQMKDGDVSVILKDVTINDTGTYECRVIQSGTNNDPISTITLRVAPPPPGPSGGGTSEDGGKEGGGKEYAFVCLQVFVVLIVVVSFVILIEYKQRRKLKKRAASY